MKYDPIIKEVRRSGKALEEEAHGDLHCFFDLLRTVQANYQPRVIKSVPKESTNAP